MFFTQDEINRFRQDTPGCKHRIHLNNAGASLMPNSVVRAIQNHIELESEVGGYEAADLKEKEIKAFYTSAANLFKCKPANIAFTSNATDSFSRAISSIVFKPGDVILTTNEDYISNQITYLSFIKRFGIKLVRAKTGSYGEVDMNDFEDCLQKYHPKLAAVTHIPTNSGLIQPIEEIGELCFRYETIYLVDACQSIGQLDLDVNKIKCDFLSVTSRKFLRGPRGTGFLFVSDNALDRGLEPLFIDMRGADWIEKDIYLPRKGAIRFEGWEFAHALVLGTAAAIDYLLLIDINKIEQQVKYFSDYLRTELQKINGITVHDRGRKLAGLVTFHKKNSDPDVLRKQLLKNNINVVASYRNYAIIDYDEKNVDWTIRVSPHYFNTMEEIDRFLEVMR